MEESVDIFPVDVKRWWVRLAWEFHDATHVSLLDYAYYFVTSHKP